MFGVEPHCSVWVAYCFNFTSYPLTFPNKKFFRGPFDSKIVSYYYTTIFGVALAKIPLVSEMHYCSHQKNAPNNDWNFKLLVPEDQYIPRMWIIDHVSTETSKPLPVPFGQTEK